MRIANGEEVVMRKRMRWEDLHEVVKEELRCAGERLLLERVEGVLATGKASSGRIMVPMLFGVPESAGRREEHRGLTVGPAGMAGKGESMVMFLQPPVALQCRSLVLSDDTAASYVLDDFKIGKDSQFPDPSPIPLDPCACSKGRVPLTRLFKRALDPVAGDMIVGLYATRVSKGDKGDAFVGVLWGEAAW